jgi:Fungal specific transcription factor domain
MSASDILPRSSPQLYSNKIIHAEIPHSSKITSQPFKQPELGFEMPGSSSLFSRRSFSQESMSPETSAANQILALSQMASTNMAASLGYPGTGLSSSKPNQVQRNGLDYLLTPITSGSSYGTDNNFDQLNPIRKRPVIDEAARQRVLSLIDRAHPKVPDGLEITRDHPLLALSVLQEYCDLYFTRFNISYPLLHQATFNPATVDPLLITSVLLLGATYSDRESHLFAICVHDIMRAQILGNPDFTTRPPLWILQTILLVECFGKSRAGQLQHDMSHLFHGLLIK